MKQTPTDIARMWLSQFDERLGWLEQVMEDLTAQQQVALHHALDKRRKVLDVLMTDLARTASQTLSDAGHKEATVDGLDGNPLQVEVTNSSRRSEVKRDMLVEAVLAYATPAVKKDTGEIESMTEAQLRSVQEAFRLEPRWTELRKLGVDPDEYATTTWTRSIKTKEFTTLTEDK